jgi:hypothetical protein
MLSSIHGLANKDESEQPMHTIKKLFINTLIVYCTLWVSVQYVHAFKGPDDKTFPSQEAKALYLNNSADLADKRSITNADPKFDHRTIQYKHGDISWLPALAAQAGWPEHTWKRLGRIILRESGGCPNRIGSSIVDKNCNITGYTKATNKSDSGLLQINGVNWDLSRNKNAIACVKFGFCSQEPLLDPLNNLKVGRALFEAAGWQPWNACNWDPSRCKKPKNVND